MKRIFYGWWIAIAAMVTLMVTNGMIIGGINVFDESLLNEFGWGRADLKFRDLLTFAIAGLLGPVVGALADRFGVKRLMLFGAALLAGSYFYYGRIQGIGQMYAIHALFALVLATCGLIVAIILVSHWFVARRGTAIGITLVGTSLGGMIFPQIGTRIIESSGWRAALQVESLAAVALFVVILVLVRDKPADSGLEPLGTGGGTTAGGVQNEGLEYGQALRTVTFWALAFAAMTTFYSILGAQAHLFLHFRDMGFTPVVASTALSVLYGMALIGKFSFGFLADHWNQKKVLLANIAVMWLGSLCLASMQPGLLWTAVVLFGLGWGGLYTLLQLLTMNIFGLKAAGKILGTITVLDAIGGGLGIWLTGLLYDRTGGYQVPFATLAALIFVAMLVTTRIKVGGVGKALSENGTSAA